MVTTISGLTLSGGHVTGNDDGGAIRNLGDLTLDSVVLVGNYSADYGGAIRSTGPLHIINSTLEGNTAGFTGGAISISTNAVGGLVIEGSAFIGNHGANYGALHLDGNDGQGTASIVNSTFSGNWAAWHAGAIQVAGNSPALTIINSTITDNHAGPGYQGGGIRVTNGSSVRLDNTILAGNTAGVASKNDLAGTLESASSYNLLGMNVPLPAGAGNFNSDQPGLAPLGDYGGATLSHALLPDSLVIDAGSDFQASAAGLALDQRGFGRTSDVPTVNNESGGVTDIGAFEFGVSALLDANGKLTVDDTATHIDQIQLALDESLLISINGQQTPYPIGAIWELEIFGGDGDDAIAFSAFDLYALHLGATVHGGGGNDSIWGTAADDWLYGDAGNDNIQGSYGNDTLDGGDGDDTLSGGNDDDVLYGAVDNDTLHGGSGENLLNGGDGDDVFLIDDVTDATIRISDAAGNDTIDLSHWIGPNGAQVDLSAPATAYQGVSTPTGSSGGPSNPSIVWLSFNEFERIENVIGSSFDDGIIGSSEDNTIIGGAGDDEIEGDDGDDQLFGDEGADELVGGEGVDELHGGPGNDDYLLEEASDVNDPFGFHRFTDSSGNVNTQPQIEWLPNEEIKIGTDLAFTALGRDPDAPPQTIQYSLEPSEPSNDAIDAALGEYEWQTSSGTVPGSYTVTLKVQDNGTPLLDGGQDVLINAYVPTIYIDTDIVTLEQVVPDEASEVGEPLKVWVNLSQPGPLTVRMEYTTADGNTPYPAIAGEDYEAVSGIVEFGPGETRKYIEISIIDDVELDSDLELDEEDETFRILLSNPENPVFAYPVLDRAVGVVTILDNIDINSDPIADMVSPAGELVQLSNGRFLVGHPNRTEGESQPKAIHGVSIPLPVSAISGSYAITFSADLWTFDSYVEGNQNDGLGYWDSFSVSVTDEPYITWVTDKVDPLDDYPEVSFIWGGDDFPGLEHNSDTAPQTKTIAGSGYLNLVLDTLTTEQTDDAFPSWGTYQLIDVSYEGESVEVAAVRNASHYERNTNGYVVVELSEMATSPMSIQYSTFELSPSDLEGQLYEAATSDEDYNETSGEVIIEPGHKFAIIELPLIDDTTHEGQEAFGVRLQSTSDAVLLDAEAIVKINDDDVKVDLRADSNNDGVIDESDDEGNFEEEGPGKIVWVNSDDDDGDGIADYEQTSDVVAADDDLVRVELEHEFPADGWDSLVTFRLQAQEGGDLIRIWNSADKDVDIPLNFEWPAPGALTPPSAFYVEGLAGGEVRLQLIAYREDSFEVVAKDTVKLTVGGGMTAYRPMHGPNSSYPPFQKTAVKEIDEEKPDLGPGIRINGDHDNGNSGVRDMNITGSLLPDENDLIEVRIDRRGMTNLVLDVGANLSLFESAQKGNRINVSETTNRTDAITFTSNTKTIFVEWAAMNHGTADLKLIDADTNVVIDTLKFHTFKTSIVVLSGENFDPVLPRTLTMNDQGLYILADPLYYDEGYDVSLWNEDNVDENGGGATYDAIASAVADRLVQNIVILGYSHGGGSTYDLADRLNRNSVGTIPFTSYIDAIENDGFTDTDSETRRPPGSLYHVNDWQPNPSPIVPGVNVNGAPTTGADRNTEHPSHVHSTVDADTGIHQQIRTDFKGRNIAR